MGRRKAARPSDYAGRAEAFLRAMGVRSKFGDELAAATRLATLVAECVNEAAADDASEAIDWTDEDPGLCTICGESFELVRPGKSQPTCECWNDDGHRRSES